MELSTTTTTTIDGDRIQEYAKKLRQSNFLETLALNVAMGIHAEITKRDETLEGFSPKCVDELENFLVVLFCKGRRKIVQSIDDRDRGMIE